MRTTLLYIAMIVGAVVIFFLIDAAGADLTAPEAPVTTPHGTPRGHGSANPLVHVLMTLVAVIALGWLLSTLFRYLGQPPVIGEVVAGIALGPSLLGQLWPDATSFLLPDSSAPFLNVVAQIGIVLYMFLVGLELDPAMLRERTKATITISHASIVLPFVLGSALALFLYPRLASHDIPFTSFALFLGVAMSITAFPVLARILTDRGMQKSRLGVIALACAATDDVTAWCLLALVVGVAQAKVSGAFITIVLTIAYLGFMFLVARPGMRWFLHWLKPGCFTRGGAALVFIALLLSSLATELIGVHAIFGAFLLGAIIPHDSVIARELPRRLGDFVSVFLLPAFFALTGMRTQIGLIYGVEAWLICGLIIGVATIGKFGGAFVAARASGIGWRESSAIGILMNTRGLMELIVLNIGLDLGVITPSLFAMMVLMAIVTTMATTPILHWIGTEDEQREPASAKAREATVPG